MRLGRGARVLALGVFVWALWAGFFPESIAEATRDEGAAAAAVGEADAAAPTRVFLVRHAEKGDDDPRDPSLSEEGAARAEALAHALGHAGVTHLFASEYRRTQDTLAPLADALELEVVVHSARDLGGLAAKLRALPPASVAVVAGHSNTTPMLAAALGAKLAGLTATARGEMLAEDEYDRLFCLRLVPDGATESFELRYGVGGDED